MKYLRCIHCFFFFFSRDIVSSVRINRTFCMLLATSETSRGLETKCVPQLFLGSLQFVRTILAELPRAKRAWRSPLANINWSPMKARKFGYDVAYERLPSVHPLYVSRFQMSGYFGGKAYGSPRLVKQRQLKSQ